MSEESDTLDEILFTMEGRYFSELVSKLADSTKMTNKAIRDEAKAKIQSMLKEARIEELKNLALAHWQKSIPEQAVLARIKELKESTGG